MNSVITFQIRGEAKAFALEAKAKAEAEQMSKKADAWRDYQEAAMVDMLLDVLPRVSRICYDNYRQRLPGC